MERATLAGSKTTRGGDEEGDVDTDAGTDGDVDAGTDADTDGDAGASSDAGGDAGGDVGSDAGGDVDTSPDGGVDADSGAAADAGSDADVPPGLARIQVTPASASVVERRTVKLVAKGFDDGDDEIDVDVTWSSSDETRATIDGTGLVTTLRPGTVTITASAGGKSDEATITITASTATSIRFATNPLNVPLGGEVRVDAIVEDAEGYELLGRAVSFESEDASIVTVTADGIATGIKEGEAKIKAKHGALEALLDVRVVSGFVQLVASARNTCGLTAGGTAWCWGDDTYGQVGVGTNGATPYEIPQRADADVSFEAVKLGRWFTCGLSKEKEVWCWGDNSDGVLGVAYASLWYSPTPRLVPNRQYEKLGTFGYGACGLDAGGFAYCWGSGSSYYELGNSSFTSDQINPVAVSAPEGESSAMSFVELRHGDYFSCGLATTGRLYCWGRNGNEYRLGDGTTTHRARAVRPLGDKVVKHFDVGLAFTCAVTNDDTTYCWGKNDKGQANPSTAGTNVTTPVVRFTPAQFVPASLALGADHACALDPEGRAQCWGSNAVHQLGRSTGGGTADIGEVQGGLRFTQLASGDNHVCGIAKDGKAYCWGENKYGQLGTGDRVDKAQPTLVVGQ